MNPEVLMILISNIYGQLLEANGRIAELEALIEASPAHDHPRGEERRGGERP